MNSLSLYNIPLRCPPEENNSILFPPFFFFLPRVPDGTAVAFAIAPHGFGVGAARVGGLDPRAGKALSLVGKRSVNPPPCRVICKNERPGWDGGEDAVVI